jgi:pimeloyl-ACP methyl ester carboxylesterase
MKDWDVDFSQIPPGLVYILHGEKDNMSPIQDAYKNVDTIPGARLEIVKDKGHFFWLNNPEILDNILK